MALAHVPTVGAGGWWTYAWRMQQARGSPIGLALSGWWADAFARRVPVRL
jgi:hypothetical protein